MLALVLVFGCAARARAGVVINEFMVATSEYRLTWDFAGAPLLGSGMRWQELQFDASAWTNALLPAGYGFAGLVTDLTSQMKGKAPSLYLRKEFTVDTEQAVATNSLVLSIQYNDGFVAWLNGREVARANCGPTNHFMFAFQPAYNVNTNTNVIQFVLGPASAWLVPGRNLLALEVHNAEQPSTVSAPEQITRHLPTVEVRVNAGLQLAGDTNLPPAELISLGTNGGPWRCLVGRVEPSGGVVDLGLVTKTFNPPAGEEDDYDQPAEFADWVELFNDGPAAVNLGGWSLSDEQSLPAKWRFPANTLLPAGGFLLVLCDGRDEANAPAGPATRLHANFKLDEQGEFLGLFDQFTNFVDGLPGGYPAQLSSCSFGRDPANPASFVYLASATPGTTNAGTTYAGRAPAPAFLDGLGNPLPGGLYRTQPLFLSLVSVLPGSTIRYTMDGSDPAGSKGMLYTNAIRLSQPIERIGIVVRALASFPGWLPSEVVTHTYLLRQPTALTNAPVLCLSGDAGRVFYAPDGVLAVVGGRFVAVNSGSIWQANGPTNYDQALGSGPPFERGASLEYFFPPGLYPAEQPPLRTDIGLRLSASSYSRPRMKLSGAAVNSPWAPGDFTEKPSFNVYFAGNHGSGVVDYPFFANYPVKTFQHLRLRAGKNDMTNPFITDELVRRLWLDMGHVGARGLFCSLYVNAVYRGIFNLCERFREPLFQHHYGSEAQWDVDYTYDWVDGDNVAYQQLLTLLDQNLSSLSNWSALTNRLDVDNAADYFLLNIYGATWDWPQNNFIIARERSTGPDSRFRFAVWDAEGAFNAIGYGHPASYNTITSDLIVSSGSPNYWTDLPRIFRRLATCPEFRLRFADRVNLHLFNGGILDDRDPDGAGPLTSHFTQVLGQLTREAGDLVKYNTGQALNLSAFTTWTSTNSGRRTYLLGSTAGRQMLRDAGLWPVTEPPVFNRFGGAVPPDFQLSMSSTVAVTGQTAVIYFTLDGADPRLQGGARNPAALEYTNAVPLNQVVTVKARARNNTTAEWSALTQATFAPAAVPASAENLVLAELMYHPPGPTLAEMSAGFTDDEEFEFARLLNIAPVPLDLAGVRFTLGITFDFTGSPARYLAPGASVLAVRNRAAFQLRYGRGCDALLAGEYSGHLDNSGERLQLLGSNAVILRDFTYGDSAPWPAAADGDGPSLVLRDPWSNPDPADPANWTSSAVPGGLPAGAPLSQSYSAWRSLFWDSALAADNSVAGPAADPDGDGLSNFLEYAFGLDPHRLSIPPRLLPALETINGEERLTVSLPMAAAATDAQLSWEASDDLRTWTADSGALQLLSAAARGDGTSLLKYLDTTSLSSGSCRFLRLRITRSQ